jgi:hypothetical protein
MGATTFIAIAWRERGASGGHRRKRVRAGASGCERVRAFGARRTRGRALQCRVRIDSQTSTTSWFAIRPRTSGARATHAGPSRVT